jgi:hypothetical protein
MGMVVSGGASFLADNLTITKNGANEATLTANTAGQIGSALCGVVLALTTNAFNPTSAKADAFSDATGAANSIDTTGGVGNTNAFFSTNKYQGNFTSSGNLVTSCPLTLVNWQSETLRHGIKITAVRDCTLTKVTKDSHCAGTKAHLYLASNNSLIETVDFVGNDAAFNQSLSSGISYNILASSGGAGYMAAIDNNTPDPSYPYTDSNVSVITGIVNNSSTDPTNWFNISSITTSAGAIATNTIKTVALSYLDGTYTKARLCSYGLILPTGTTATFDIDLTGGGSYTITNGVVDTWVDLGGSKTFNGAKLRIALNQGTASDSVHPSIQGYCLMVV